MDDVNTRRDLVAWIDAKLGKLNGPHPNAFASNYWPQVWDDAIGYADALGLADDVDSLGGPVRQPTWVAEVDGEYDYDTPQKAVRNRVSKRLVGLRMILTGDAGKGDEPDYYVTLLQMAAIVGREKKTLQRLYEAGELPAPAVQGGRGKPHEWKWGDVRPILEDHYRKGLPAIFPADRFVRS